MTEKKEAVPEVAGLSKRNDPGIGDEYYVPDYVMRDFGELEEISRSFGGTYGRHSDAGFLL